MNHGLVPADRAANNVLDLHLPISNDIVPTKIYDKREDLILKFSFSHF